MESMKSPTFLLMLVLVLGMVFVAYNSSSPIDDSGISVTGTATKAVSPDQLVINIGVITLADTAKEAEDENAIVMDQVMDALKELGLENDEIETQYFRVYPKYNYGEKPATIEGYEARHTITVETKQTAKAGEIIDAATGAGANNIGNVDFTLSNEYKEELRLEVMGNAAADAKDKASAIAKGLKVSLGKPISVENSPSYSPYRAYAGMEMAGISMDDIPTQIESSDIDFTVNLYVKYGIR